MPRVAILIVTYNSAREIDRCLRSVEALSATEVLVIDNASADQTLAIAEHYNARLIRNESNVGFAAAVNQGVRATSAELLLLLNPDAQLITGLDALMEAFHGRVGAAGGLLVDEEGKPQQGFTARRLPSPTALIFEVLGINRLFPANPVNWRYRCFDLDLTQGATLVDVTQPPGAFLMFSRTAWNAVGGFDENFWPLWFEDVDFCERLRKAGFQIKFSLASVAKHTGGHSIKSLSLENRDRYWYGSLLKYAAKHYRSLAFRTVCVAVAVGSVLRFFRGFTRQGLKVFAVHSAVFRLAAGRFWASYR